MSRHNYLFLLLIFILLAIVSCDKEEIISLSADRTFGIRHDRTLAEYEALVNDETKDKPSFSSVVNFQYSLNGSGDKEFTATGTLIDEQWILTAGHNFYVAEEQDEPAPVSGISVLIGDNPNSPEQEFEVDEIVYHPTWISYNQDFKGGNDLCLVKLKTSVTNITPIPLFTSNEEQIGGKVWFCGFGDYTRLEGQDAELLSKKHALENILDRKNDGITTSIDGNDYVGGLLAFDFDNPENTINSLGDDLVNEDEALLGEGDSDVTALEFEGTTITGDSGGPLFIKDNNTWKLAGVLSGGALDPINEHEESSYGDISVFIRVSPQIEWIESVVNE